MTRSFMRVREIHFFEAHTAHASFEDAEQQIREDLQMNERIMRLLALPYLISRRPDWDKFPGAHYSLVADTLLPSGRAAQLATFHHYRDNFAKVYDVTFETEKGEHRFVHQTTDGMSERLLGALISIHGDEKGLVLPPAAAPGGARPLRGRRRPHRPAAGRSRRTAGRKGCSWGPHARPSGAGDGCE